MSNFGFPLDITFRCLAVWKDWSEKTAVFVDTNCTNTTTYYGLLVISLDLWLTVFKIIQIHLFKKLCNILRKVSACYFISTRQFHTYRWLKNLWQKQDQNWKNEKPKYYEVSDSELLCDRTEILHTAWIFSRQSQYYNETALRIFLCILKAKSWRMVIVHMIKSVK